MRRGIFSDEYPEEASRLSNRGPSASAGCASAGGWEGDTVGSVCCQATLHVRNSLTVHRGTISKQSGQSTHDKRDPAGTPNVESTLQLQMTPTADAAGAALHAYRPAEELKLPARQKLRTASPNTKVHDNTQCGLGTDYSQTRHPFETSALGPALPTHAHAGN